MIVASLKAGKYAPVINKYVCINGTVCRMIGSYGKQRKASSVKPKMLSARALHCSLFPFDVCSKERVERIQTCKNHWQFETAAETIMGMTNHCYWGWFFTCLLFPRCLLLSLLCLLLLRGKANRCCWFWELSSWFLFARSVSSIFWRSRVSVISPFLGLKNLEPLFPAILNPFRTGS